MAKVELKWTTGFTRSVVMDLDDIARRLEADGKELPAAGIKTVDDLRVYLNESWEDFEDWLGSLEGFGNIAISVHRRPAHRVVESIEEKP